MSDTSPSPDASLNELEQILGYNFKDRSLLEAALTHSSYRYENPQDCTDNERLEFLGDAVLGLILADIVYRRYQRQQEGTLTILRSHIASEPGLAAVARDLGLGRFLRLGRGEELSGGRNRDSMLADAMEAILGALYLDAGIAAATSVFERTFEQRLNSLPRDHWADNPKGKLQQISLRRYQIPPSYRTLSEEGPPHAKIFTAEVALGEHCRATGSGTNKQSAQVAAAEALLAQLDREAD